MFVKEVDTPLLLLNNVRDRLSVKEDMLLDESSAQTDYMPTFSLKSELYIIGSDVNYKNSFKRLQSRVQSNSCRRKLLK